MSTRKKLKQVAERVDKIAKVINSSQANVMYANGFILGATAGGSGGKTYTGGNGITVDNTANTISINTTSGIDDAILTGTTTVENATVSGDFTLQKGAKFTGGSGAALDIECETEFDGSSVSFTNNASLNVADNTTVTGLIKSLGNEAVSGEPYHFTYYIDTQLNGYDLTTTLYTITLDNNKTLQQYSKTITLPTGTNVEANPTLAGTETELTGLQVGTTKYKVPSGSGSSHLYQHNLKLIYTNTSSQKITLIFSIYTNSATALDTSTYATAITSYFTADTNIVANGELQPQTNQFWIYRYLTYTSSSQRFTLACSSATWNEQYYVYFNVSGDTTWTISSVNDFVKQLM